MPDESEPAFEQALTRLEKIVDELERGEPALSSALAQYENGVQLLRHCYRLLDQAEQSVALLTGVDSQGNPLTIPFAATATATVARDLTSQREPLAREPATKDLTTDRNDPAEGSEPPF
jgi:exodeoxyribonuclease VII small subunit